MKNKDFYEILGVSPDVDEKELRKAYLKLAVKYHPDHNQGDEEAGEKFKDISQAYSVLNNKEEKARYDAYKNGGFSQNGFGGSGFGEGMGFNFENGMGFEFVNFEKAQAGFEEAMHDLFNTEEGRETLKNLENDFAQMGFFIKGDDLNKIFSGINSGNNQQGLGLFKIARGFIWAHTKNKVKNNLKEKAFKVGNFFKKLIGSVNSKTKLNGKTALGLSNPNIEGFIYLTAGQLNEGAEIEYQYWQDREEKKLKITVPKGLKFGNKLALKGQGNLKNDNFSRGDLILTLLAN